VQIRDLLKLEFEKEIGITSSLIRCIPEDKLKWKPVPKSWNLQERISHLADIPAWLPWTVECSELDLASKKNAPYVPLAVSAAHAQELLHSNAKAALDKLASLTESAFSDVWTLRNGPKVLYTGTAYFVIREFVINHLVHHRGQLSLCLRLLDLPLPPIYSSVAETLDLEKKNSLGIE
jgi:uncharacterized damage-inducible protein DinB